MLFDSNGGHIRPVGRGRVLDLHERGHQRMQKGKASKPQVPFGMNGHAMHVWPRDIVLLFSTCI